MVDDDSKEIVIDTLAAGFANESRILGVAYALNDFGKCGMDSDELSELERRFVSAVQESNFVGILENQIDYYVSLVDYDGKLIWEEKEKVDELEVGIAKMLDLGIACDEKFVSIFHCGVEKWQELK